jgi:hypothetical protein
VKKIVLSAAAAILLCPHPIQARGHSVPLPPTAIANGSRIFLKIMPAGSDGFYLVWNSTHPTGSAIFGQFFGVDGSPRWLPSGLMLAGFVEKGGAWDACPDGKSGFLLATADKVHRFGEEGHSLWSSPSSPAAMPPVISISAVEDGSGGAYVAWEQQMASGPQIDVQHWNDLGKALWKGPGLAPAESETTQTRPIVVRDGQGGVLVGWKSKADEISKARLQRLTGGGERVWREHGVDVQSPAGDLHQRLILAAPGNGDAVVAWTNGLDGKNRVFFQHVEPDGRRDWTSGGIADNISRLIEQWNPVLLGDGRGNLWIGWEEVAEGADARVKVVRRDAPQGAMWPPKTLALAGTPGSQGRLDLALDGEGGLLAVWMDNRTSTGIYLQRIDAQGHLLLGDGKAVAVNLRKPQYPHMAVLPHHRVAVGWLNDQGDKHWALQTAVVDY